MSDEERPDSLAEQAAAWVPPWQRPAPQADATAPGEAAQPDPTDPAASTAASAPAVRTASPDPGPLSTTSGSGKPGVRVPLQGAVPAGTEMPETDARKAGAPGDRGTGAGAPGDDAPGPVRRRPMARVRPAPEPAPALDDAELRGALEAILLVVDEPVSELVLAQVLEQPAERIGPMLDEIAAGFTAAGHGFELRRAAGGWRLYTRPEYATYVERFVLDGQSVRLTQAALETLAVVAYKQPVTRSRISAIRGVNCDGVIRTLVTRGLVEECGTESDSGAHLYRTSTMFLEKLGLNSLDDLPPLAPFLPDDVEELADAAR
ncbi:SMC-Scp complex subunit ScpB [Micromonospora sp. HNM0581]|uniref:SMC-Scp complex subunit ScpB n=1 Tax=Micromonospora sp. HNM0581 TaxID=2716341 RepID=UPI00146F32D8|nr:SMC-Scp complex subunit ScpB [Micromonospora sp. HNM0581]NLU80973.1 SMC-Scp complex subunit ScpB [Micromonospora sp. HNM0581]